MGFQRSDEVTALELFSPQHLVHWLVFLRHRAHLKLQPTSILYDWLELSSEAILLVFPR